MKPMQLPERYACKGEGKESDQIRFGSKFLMINLQKKSLILCFQNPPFGTPWKTDLKAWGIGKKDEISDSRFIINYVIIRSTV